MHVSGNDLHVVVGASGATGGALVRELARRGRWVRAVNRAGDADVPAGVERLAADVATPDGAKAAAAGAAVVYHCAQPPYTDWPAAFPPLTDAITEGATAAGAKLVFADNLYLYGPHAGPLTEDLPAAATGPKGRTRARMAERLLAAHRDGRLRVAIGHASNYYGPGGLASVTGERLFKAAVAGRTVRWVGRLDQPHTLSYLEDVAAALATLGERDQADGQAWHLPAAEPLTGRQFLELVVAASGGRSRIATNSAAMTRLAGLFSPMIREVGEVLYEFQSPVRGRLVQVPARLRPVRPHPARRGGGPRGRLVSAEAAGAGGIPRGWCGRSASTASSPRATDPRWRLCCSGRSHGRRWRRRTPGTSTASRNSPRARCSHSNHG